MFPHFCHVTWTMVGGRWPVVNFCFGRWSVRAMVGGQLVMWSVVGFCIFTGRWLVFIFENGRWSVVGVLISIWSVVGASWSVVCGLWSVAGRWAMGDGFVLRRNLDQAGVMLFLNRSNSFYDTSKIHALFQFLT